MTRSILFSSVAACICLGLAAPVLAAEPAATATPPGASGTAAAAKPAEKCLADLRAFDSHMKKGGYWLSGSGYGFGYPMMGGYGFGYGYPMMAAQARYSDVRPGYDVRTLIAAANILARSGQQQACEDLLAATQNTYKLYVADLKSGKTSTANEPDWQQRQVAAATPVTAKDTSFRSDQLIGTEVRNSQNDALGSVDDVHLRSVEAVTGYHIHARDGEIGHVEDFLVDDADWSIQYLIIDTKNWWPGKKILVSSRSAGEIDWTNRLVNLDVGRQRIKDSPAYDPSMTIDRAYDEKFQTYYGIKFAAA